MQWIFSRAYDFLFGDWDDTPEAVEEVISAVNKGRILKYYRLLEHFTTKRLDIQSLLEQSSKIFLAEVNELKSTNFANLIIMLYNCCGSEFHNVIIEKKNLYLLFEMLNSMSQINNIASKKLGLFIKFLDCRSSSIFSTEKLLAGLRPEDFQSSSWVPEMSFAEFNELEVLLFKNIACDQELLKISRLIGSETDTEKVHDAKLQAEAYSNRIKRDQAFFRDVVQSFLPLENMMKSMNRFSNKAEETLANINNLLQQASEKEIYRALEKNFIEPCGKQVDTKRIEARIESATDEKQFETIKVEVLPLISNIEEDYQILNGLLNHENIEKPPNKTEEKILEQSQQTEKPIEDMPKAFSEAKPKDFYLRPSAIGQTRPMVFASCLRGKRMSISPSRSAAFASPSKTKTLSSETFQCPHCEKMFYSGGFLQTHLNFEHTRGRFLDGHKSNSD
ncbi:hypothetical protein Aperf_G00000048387 [Anoplocephala perfoliata]